MTQKQQRFSNQQISTDLNSFDLNSFKRDAIAKIYQGKPLTGKDGIFSDMIKDILETALGEELNQHLDLEKLNLGDDFNNRKNGFNSKTVKTKESAFVLNTPRDRNSSFEPQIVKEPVANPPKNLI